MRAWGLLLHKQVVAGLVVLGALLLFATFYLGSEVFPGALSGGADDAAEVAPAASRSAAADVFKSWGITAPDNIDDIEVTTPENSPLEYVALDSAFLSGITGSVEGRIACTIESVDGERGATVRTQMFEALDQSGDGPVVRSLAVPVTAYLVFGDGVAETIGDKPLRAGELVQATVTLEPATEAGTGRVDVQIFERMSGAGSGSSN